MREYDIVICGGGLVGLLLANLLKDSPYDIALVDAGMEPTAPSTGKQRVPLAETQHPESNSGYEFVSGYAPRVSALNAHSVGLLDRCDVISKISRSAPFKRMEIKDGEGAGEIAFDASEIDGATSLGVVVENHLVINALLEQLRDESQVTLLFEHKLEALDEFDGLSELTFENGTSLQCQLLVAADGGNSKVRELMGQKVLGWNYDQTAIVTTIKTQQAHGNIPRQWFTAAGPLAFLPLADDNLCSIVWSHTAADDLLALSAKTFCQELTSASEHELGEVIATDQRFSFPLRQQHAVRYHHKGVVLIGDAAHAIHPLAGQGANLGFADAAVLSSELRQAVFSEVGLKDPGILRRFSRIRQPQNLLVAGAMETIKRLYGHQHPALGFARNHLMRFANSNGALKSTLMKVASGAT